MPQWPSVSPSPPLSSPSSLPPKTLIISIIWPPPRHLPLVINMYLCVNAAP